MIQPSILIFNEDTSYLSKIAIKLQGVQYLVTAVDHPAEVLELLQKEQYDLLILDICPFGWEDDSFLDEVRHTSAIIPMVAVTGTPCLETAIYALRYKLYDYLEKSVSLDTLLVRIQEILIESHNNMHNLVILNQMQALLNKYCLEEIKSPILAGSMMPINAELFASSFSRGPYTVNLNTREVICSEKQIKLSPTEFNYWVALLRHEPEIISYKSLVKEAQSYDMSGREAMNLARWHIHVLRKIFESKWGNDPIQTIRGVGYRVLV
jgi:DNA-binding response OmpR family regulator